MSEYSTRRYLIIPSTIINSINFNEVMETSINTLRYSIDKTKTFVKYTISVEPVDRTETYIDPETNQPVIIEINSGIYGRPSVYSEEYLEYTHEEILEVLQTEEWNDQLNEIN